MTCIKKIQNTEVFGSKFSSRTLTTAGDISEYSFKAVVKNIIQGKILEIAGIKNAGTINFDFSQLQTLKKSTYQIEYWGDFGALGNEPFLIEELSIVSAENATNCANSDNLNFEIKFEEISIPVTITKAINNFSLNIENLTPEQIALIKGEKGDKGDKGDAGEKGAQGEKGEKGDIGLKGDKGDKGDTGATGLQGIQGIQGVKGDKGEKGDKGDKGDAFTYADFTPTQIAELQKPATDKVEELNQLETTLTNSEILRVQNENTRISNEETRNTNEQTRVNSENNRVTAETSRSSSENTRITAETERVSNENLRKTSENARVSAETSRSTAETSRVSAENTRVNSENTRISNENSRVTAEISRVTAENARVAAELERQQNKAFNVKITTPSSWVTGTMSETEVLRIVIPANSISDNSFLNMPILYLNKIGANGYMNIKGKLSTSPTMPSGTTDQIFNYSNIAATNLSFGMDRMYIVSDGLIKGFPFTVSSYSSSSANINSFGSKPFDRTVINYLYVSIQLANSSDQARLEGIQLTNS